MLVQLLSSCCRGRTAGVEDTVENNLKGQSENSARKHETDSQHPQTPTPPPASPFSSPVSSLSPAPMPSTFKPWPQNPLYTPPASKQNDPMPCFDHVRWEEHLVESIPFSCAIVTSDAKEVLFKKHGLEPAAARLLDQALLSNSTSHPLDGPLLKKAAEENRCSKYSFLAALLGPELEAVAKERAQGERFWKGTISVNHPMEDQEAQSGSSVAICGTHAGLEASSPKPLLGISTAADNAHCKDVLGTEAVGMGAEGFTANGVEGAADAGVHTAETPQSAARSLRMEGRLGPAGRACRWGQASSSPGQAEHTASVLGSGGEDPVSAHPTEPTAVGWPAAGARTEGRLQKRSAAAHEAAAAALETEAAAQKAAAAAQEAAAAAVPSSFKGKKHPHRTASAPNVSADVGPGQKPAPEPKLRKDWPGQKPINIENKSVRWGSLVEPETTKYPHVQSCDSRPCIFNEPMQMRTCKTDDEGDGGVRNGNADDCMIPATARSSNTVKPPPLTRSKSLSSAMPRSNSRRSSLCMSKEAMECFKNGNDESMTRTVALLKSLSQQAQATTDPEMPRTSKKPAQDRRRRMTETQLTSTSVSPFFRESKFHSGERPTVTAPDAAPDCKLPGALSSSDLAHKAPVGQYTYQRKPPSLPHSPQRGSTPNLPPIPRRASSSVVQSLDGGQHDDSQVDFADQMSIASTRAGSWEPDQSLPRTSNSGVSEEAHLDLDRQALDTRPSLIRTVSDVSEGGSAQLLEKAHKHPLSFDVMVSRLWPHMGKRSPLLVIICNSTDHWQVRTILTELAESQLDLLSSIMPQHAIEFLATESSEAIPEHVGQLARAHKGVTLLFMDIVGFTSMSKNVKPVEVMVFLNKLFSLFDRLTDEHGVHKVETAGDCYIVSGGIMSANQSENGFGLVVEDQDPEESAKRVMEFAKAMLEAAKQVNMPDTNEPVRVRVGLHTGDVVSGLIGSKLPKFSIFGDAMNTASRMESTGVPGRIHVSETTQKLLPAERWESTGGVQVKGKGQMQTYLWVPPMAGAVSPPVSSFKPSSTDGAPCLQAFKHTHKLLRQLNEAHAAQAAIAMIEPARHGVRKGREAGVGASGSSCALFFRRSVPVMKPDTV